MADPLRTGPYEVDVEDLEYLRHGDEPLCARVFKPRGKGPFPALVDSHGGAWIQGTYANNDPINQRVARGGVVVMSADYRVPPAASYPGSVADTNFAIRWLKMNAARFDTRPDWVGAMGTSAGGHLVVLSALKPFDPRYAAIELPGCPYDARVPFVVAMWPVICPWGRYQDLLRHWERNQTHHAGRVGGGREQMTYWLTEEAMADGSPTLALERGDQVELPDILYVQAAGDTLHPRANLEQFVSGFRRAGGSVEVLLVEGEPYDLVRTAPESAQARRALTRMVEFIREHAALAAT